MIWIHRLGRLIAVSVELYTSFIYFLLKALKDQSLLSPQLCSFGAV